ncbi:hypothetical protein CGMCC3_g17896, partial [Colletotrichum fructicola]
MSLTSQTHTPKQSSAAANDALALTLTGVGAHFDPPCGNANPLQTLASCNEVGRNKRDASDEDSPDLDLEANACATLYSCFEVRPDTLTRPCNIANTVLSPKPHDIEKILQSEHFAVIDWDDDGFSCFNVRGECHHGGTEITSEK